VLHSQSSLIVENREVQGQAQANWMSGPQLKILPGPFCQIVWTNWLPEMEKIMAMVRTATEPTKIGSNLLEQELQDSCQD